MKKIIDIICVIIGTITLVIGTAGIVLPILPTVPFYLLTAAFYAKGSEKFHRWFLSTKLYKKHIEEVVTRKEMTRCKKIKVLSVLMLMFTITFIAAPIWHMKALMVVIALGHLYFFIFKIRTVKTEVCKS